MSNDGGSLHVQESRRVNISISCPGDCSKFQARCISGKCSSKEKKREERAPSCATRISRSVHNSRDL